MSWGFLFPLVPIPGSGKYMGHYVHVDDVVAAALHLVYAMGHQEISGRAFNVSDDTPASTEESMVEAAKELRVRPPFLHVPELFVRLFGLMIPYGVTVPFYGVEREEIPILFWDNVFDNSRLKSTGYHLKYPDSRIGMEIATMQEGRGSVWVGGTLMIGTPERPITRDMLFPVTGIEEDKIIRNPAGSGRTPGVSFLVSKEGHM